MIKKRVESTRLDSVDAAMGTVDSIKELAETAKKEMHHVIGLINDYTKGVTTEGREEELEDKIYKVATALTNIHTESMVALVSISVTGFITEVLKDQELQQEVKEAV